MLKARVVIIHDLVAWSVLCGQEQNYLASDINTCIQFQLIASTTTVNLVFTVFANLITINTFV
jgi:hypothetical protein